MKTLMIHTDKQIVTDLSWQSIDDLEVVSSNLTGAVFDDIYFVLCNFIYVR